VRVEAAPWQVQIVLLVHGDDGMARRSSEDHSHSAAKAPSKSARPRSQTWRCVAQRIAWFAMVVIMMVLFR
jgi:hypothetical protein